MSGNHLSVIHGSLLGISSIGELVGQAKLALAEVSFAVVIAQAAAAKLTIDDFEEGPFASPPSTDPTMSCW